MRWPKFFSHAIGRQTILKKPPGTSYCVGFTNYPPTMALPYSRGARSEAQHNILQSTFGVPFCRVPLLCCPRTLFGTLLVGASFGTMFGTLFGTLFDHGRPWPAMAGHGSECLDVRNVRNVRNTFGTTFEDNIALNTSVVQGTCKEEFEMQAAGRATSCHILPIQ